MPVYRVEFIESLTRVAYVRVSAGFCPVGDALERLTVFAEDVAAETGDGRLQVAVTEDEQEHRIDGTFPGV